MTRLRMATAATRPRVPEKVEQAHVVQLLRSVGGAVYVLGTRRRATDYHGTMQTPGLPDLVAFLPVLGDPLLPRVACVFIECKAQGGRLRPEQILFRERSLAAGVAHIVGDLDAVIAWLVERGIVKANQFPHYRHPKERPHV